MAEYIDDETTINESIQPASLRKGDSMSVFILGGPARGQWFQLPPVRAVLGRHPEVEVHIPDPAVSRRHAAIRVDESGAFFIDDLGSCNGTHIDGVRIKSRQLTDGDRIQISAQTVLRIRLHGPTETAILDQMHREATTDALTGTYNRRYLSARLDQELAFARRAKLPISLLMIDVDNFKQINDQYGHPAGDELLKAVSRALQEQVRLEEVLGRYGGDEFAIVARGDVESAVQLAERLCANMRSQKFEIGPDAVSVTLSIGVAGFTAAELDQSSEVGAAMVLLGRTDAALYQTKRGGRDGVSRWTLQSGAVSPETPWYAQTNTEPAPDSNR